VQVLDEDDDRLLPHEILEELDPRLVQALARREGVQVAGDVEAERQAEHSARVEEAERRLGRIAFEQPQVLLQHLSERPVGDALAVGQAAARPPEGRRVLVAEPLPELPREPRLAHAGVAHHRHDVRAPITRDSAERRLEQSELALAPDEGAPEAADAARPHQRQGAHEAAALDPSRLALRLHRRRLLELKRATRSRNGALAGEDLGRRGRLL
jgi:hypothetical protein